MSHSPLAPRLALAVGVPFFLIACTFAYYGQLHRKPSGDTTATIYTAVAIVNSGSIWLDRYVPLFQERFGEQPFMLVPGRDNHTINIAPFASTVLALPIVAVLRLAGVDETDWDTWMEAGMLTAALVAAASAALLFVLLTRLTTRERAGLVTAVYAFGTIAWGVTGQALWQHGGAVLALVIALLALVDRRFVLAGAALAAMVAFRFSTPVIVVLLLPLVGRAPRSWVRIALGAVPVLAGLAIYNWLALGSVFEQGYGTGHVMMIVRGPIVLALVACVALAAAAALTPRRWWLPVGLVLLCIGTVAAIVLATDSVTRIAQGTLGLTVSPGRGMLVYSPVLAFSILGAVRGWRTPLYRWCALAAAAYVIVMGNSIQWHGGESFGPRRLAEIVPLLAILLVPALELLSRPRWRVAFSLTLAWSVLVQVVAAATWPPGNWWDVHDRYDPWVWWHPTDNEIVASFVDEPDLISRVGIVLAITVTGLLVGLVVQAGLGRSRQTGLARSAR